MQTENYVLCSRSRCMEQMIMDGMFEEERAKKKGPTTNHKLYDASIGNEKKNALS